MPRRFQMQALEARCRKRVDQPASGGPLADEWKNLISEQYGDLYSVVADAGLAYFEYTSQIVTTGAASYAEPVNHLATVGLDQIVSTTTGERRPLEELMSQERARWSGMSGDARYYALVDDKLYLYPTPPAGQTYELRYIAQPPDLATYANTDVVDVVTPDGEAFLIWGVAVKAHGILETDAVLAVTERDKARERLADWATMRAFNGPRRRVVVDTGLDDPFGIGYDAADWRNR